jgi:hypothetical protein
MEADMPNMSDFDELFKPHFEKKLLEICDPLSDTDQNRTNTWIELYLEDDISLQKRSSSRRSIRRRARYFVRRVFNTMGAELFTLCSLTFYITSLPTIKSEFFYTQLNEWWISKGHQPSLSKLAGDVCKKLPIPSNISMPIIDSNQQTKRKQSETTQTTASQLPVDQHQNIPFPENLEDDERPISDPPSAQEHSQYRNQGPVAGMYTTTTSEL